MTLNAQLDRFKRINKSLFKDDFNKKTFSRIANQKNPYNSFLDKYNYITEHIFGQKIKSINRLSFEQMVQNQFSRNLKRKIKFKKAIYIRIILKTLRESHLKSSYCVK